MASAVGKKAVASAMLPMIFDTHCHIGLIRREKDPVPAGVLPRGIGNLPGDLVYDAEQKAAKAVRSGVPRLMIIGLCDKTSEQAAHVAAIAKSQMMSLVGAPDVPSFIDRSACWAGYSVGIHPHSSQHLPSMWARIDQLAREGVKLADGKTVLKPVAIGECGLDYFKSTASKEEQFASLKAHTMLSLELGLPIILHLRDAYDDFFACMKEWGITRLTGVFHCFSSTVQHMLMGVELGLKISFCGTLTYPKSHELRAAMTACPPNSYVFETDSPFLPPQSNRGGINMPSNVTEVVACAAELRKEDPAAVAACGWKNSCELFQIQ